MKSNSLGFSFGYLITDSYERSDGIREIRGLDIFEISTAPTPMNSATRVVSTKSIDAGIRAETKAGTACRRGSNWTSASRRYWPQLRDRPMT